ncbi:MAG: ATP-dependent helicase, partial [Desulfobacterales bacterium]|nr:ATP-dependent helicase [Desulfobacterales bacterium]
AMVIQAGPGTGKTRTLTAKIAHLVSKKDIDPGNILALTFTNKAAGQLKKRIDKYVPKTKESVPAATFHSFCLRLLKKYKGFNAAIGDDPLRLSLVREAMGGKAKTGAVKRKDQLICLCKQNLLGPDDDLKEIIKDKDTGNFKDVYQAYQAFCREQNVVDFEDLIFMTVRMLIDDEEILSNIRKRYHYIFIDEYQDLNFGQYELAKLISKDNHIVVIGDPDQSIYGFRGSDNKYFKRFALDFPGCEKIILTKNYRSTQTILDASFQMISKSLENEEKFRIFSDAGSAKKLIIKETATEYAEAVAIGKMIEKFVGGTSFFSMDAGKADPGEQKEYSFADFAILYRTRRQCEAFISVFEKEGIPFQTADKNKLFEIDGIKQLISLCRNMVQNEDFPDELKDCDTETWLKFLCQKEDFNKIIKGNDKAEQAFEKLLSIARLHNDLKDFLNVLALNQDTDILEFNVEKVSLMTMHAAKGLEFPVVFVSGCEQGLIPFAKDGENTDDLEEERRLFYVAMTRAMDILCLTYAKKRSIYGKSFKRQRSCFIEDIEKRLTQVEKSFVHMKVREKAKQLELF